MYIHKSCLSFIFWWCLWFLYENNTLLVSVPQLRWMCFYFSLYFSHQRKWEICVSLWVSNVRVAASWSLFSSLCIFMWPFYMLKALLLKRRFINTFNKVVVSCVRGDYNFWVQFSLKMLSLGISWVLCGRSGDYTTPWLVGLSRNDAGWKCQSHFTKEETESWWNDGEMSLVSK